MLNVFVKNQAVKCQINAPNVRNYAREYIREINFEMNRTMQDEKGKFSHFIRQHPHETGD